MHYYGTIKTEWRAVCCDTQEEAGCRPELKEEIEMATLEQVEKLREKANVSYEEARAALDACDGDILEALIWLEKQGKAGAPAGGGYYSSAGTEPVATPVCCGGQQKSGSSFKDCMGKFGRFCAKVFRIGNTNYLVGMRHGEEHFACPVTALVLLVVFFFWVVVPLFILSLFFGFRYCFRGTELGTEPVNKVMNGVADTAEDIKKNFNGESK